MKLVEAKIVQPKGQQMHFVIDISDEIFLIGPFASAEDANMYMQYMLKTYGETHDDNATVALNMDYVVSQTPAQYEKLVSDHYDWLNDET